AAPKEWDIEEHHAFAEKCAEECIVLLKNDGALPLKADEKVCVIGDFAKNPRYQGAGSSVVNPTKLDSFFECMTVAGKAFTYAQGFNRYGKKKNGLLKKAVAAAKEADKIVFFAGLDEVTEAEGLDRNGMKLPENQLAVLSELYKLGKPVVVVLSCGSAVELDVINDASALLHAYLGGQAGAKAVMNVLYGEVNPSGKLAESYPVKYEDSPSAPYFPGEQMTVEYRESVFVGYRYYSTAGVKTAYPFGYGMSYTTFEYSDLKVSDDGVSFVITNTGECDGAEVAQLYIGKSDGEAFRPLRELKGFKKVFIKAGESVTVEMPFDERTFRIFNQSANAWQTESGKYTVEIGASSEDIRLTDTHEVKGDATDFGCDKEMLKDYYACKTTDISDEAFEALLARPIPKSGYNFYKKKRMVIHENCTVGDLRYSKRWVGRAFAGVIRFAIRFLRGIGKRTTANTLVMGVLHQPVRGLAKFGGMSRRQMEALMMMFNGHLFKGVGRFLTKGKKAKDKNK
ncbi:MAG: glycoside hydrolase family 3 C-terminal domain-containing protein, partial [Clostridiales bacterium]|nr:glycoside hydrolase family 3 C-terminal domain-containing protein [Clostridiales bacterium]